MARTAYLAGPKRACHPLSVGYAAEAPLALTGQVRDGKPRQGTQITFLPSAKFFTPAAFDFAMLEEGLRRLVLANAGVNLVLRDRRSAEERAVVLTSGSGIT